MQKIKLLISERIGLQGILNETYAKGGLDLSGLLMAQKIVGFLVMSPADQKAVDWVVDEKNNLIKWNTAKDKINKIGGASVQRLIAVLTGIINKQLGL